MKIGHVLFFFFASLLFLFPYEQAHALNYGNGVYTNICGTGLAATANSCNRGCNTASGSCSSSSAYVVKFTCDGKQTECRNNESSFSTSHSFSGTSCGKTVQIDVFNKVCRVNGNWLCADGDLQDYMVWYSGDCQSQPNPTATRAPTPTKRPAATPTPTYRSSCDELVAANVSNAFVPATVTLRARATDNGGNIQQYRFFFGNGQTVDSPTPEVQHKYEVSGTFIARVDIKDSHGIWKTSSACQTTVKILGTPIESHKSDCSNIFITDGNNVQAPTTAKFLIAGFDNKGGIKRYKIDYGNGVVKEGDSGRFEQVFDTSGTYTIKGYVQDSKNTWKGGSGSCQTTLYVQTKPLTTQPTTGTPTAFTLAAVISGIAGVIALGSRKKFFLRKIF